MIDISQGVALLNAVARTGWEKGINLADLQMADQQNCIIGQLNRRGYLGTVDLFNPYYAGLLALRIWPESGDVSHYGFNRPSWGTLKWGWVTYADLERAWRSYLQPFQEASVA